jgi:hypothetical protein
MLLFFDGNCPEQTAGPRYINTLNRGVLGVFIDVAQDDRQVFVWDCGIYHNKEDA